ncbi:uncharacterized protein KY384_007803 [Bacidia gigantensis]|uniref:uncharacterized protein n=1 Tax=Bacidia gigantensis TaxID=2732470 RepID=UPI001D03E394|nr:uncharacterized protein KY384_007803 [Bacidia gigantensis]KAG8527650.1 hypothetical protein KY384_007803 [Bacidia gigantensis]
MTSTNDPANTPDAPPVVNLGIEDCKRNAANAAVREHFPASASYVGIGSGTTIEYVVKAILALNLPNINQIAFVPTGYQSRKLIHESGLRDIKFDSLPSGALIDVAFDGADEVDEDLNCIKGEEHACIRRNWWLRRQRSSPKLREGQMAKAGPLKTDQDNFIIDAPFPTLLLHSDIIRAEAEGEVQRGEGEGGVWEVVRLALSVKALEGVLSVGIFSGLNGLQAARVGDGTGGQKPIAAYFGMADGSVVVRGVGSNGNVMTQVSQT